jgi:iron complex transport system permease protein
MRRTTSFHLDGMLGASLLLAACLIALAQGRYPLPATEVGRFALAAIGVVDLPDARYTFLHNLIVDIRLPRVLTAVLVGASLSASGSAYQAVFRNPLVSPSLMGVLAGASAGAALGIVLGCNWIVVQLGSFCFGLLAVVIAVSIAQIFGRNSIVMMVLGGIVSTALFSSLLNLLKYVADPNNQLPAIVYWLMGNLGQASLNDLAWVCVPMLISIAVLCRLGRAMDALTMGDDEARALGVPAGMIRLMVIALATLLSAFTVSLAGMIGWIGLIVPHIARLLVGPGNARLIPASAWMGAIFLLFADSLARNLSAAEIPIGIVTELLGIPVFILVLSRVKKGWSA